MALERTVDELHKKVFSHNLKLQPQYYSYILGHMHDLVKVNFLHYITTPFPIQIQAEQKAMQLMSSKHFESSELTSAQTELTELQTGLKSKMKISQLQAEKVISKLVVFTVNLFFAVSDT